jgi:hypothetical protein
MSRIMSGTMSRAMSIIPGIISTKISPITQN